MKHPNIYNYLANIFYDRMVVQINQMNEIEQKGLWWVAGHSNDEVGGKLTFSPDSPPHLELYGSFENSIFLKNNRRSRILGITSDNDLFTLEKPYSAGESGVISRRTSARFEDYGAELLLRGSLYENNLKAPSFNKVRTSFPLLNDWAEHLPVSTSRGYPPDPGTTIEVSLDIPDERYAQTAGFDLQLRSRGGTSTSIDGSGSFEITPEFVIEPKRPDQSISECLYYVIILRNLLSFATDATVRPNYVILSNEASGQGGCRVFYNTQGTNPDSKHPYRMLFQLSDCRGGFKESINRWYKMSVKLNPVIDLYSTVMYSDSMTIEPKFLSLMQCLEGYYTRIRKSRYVSRHKWDLIREDFKNFISGDIGNIYDNSGMVSGGGSKPSVSRLKTLNQAYGIDPDLINKMKPVVKYANEHSLRKKVRELVRDHEYLIKCLPHNLTNRVDTAVDTRNYHVHQSEQKKSHIAEGRDLLTLTWAVQQLLETFLLSDMGVDDTQIIRRLNKKYDRSVR